MSARRPTPRAGRAPSVEFRMMAREAIRTYNATRHTLPKCEAVRRTDGGICQQIAMANGRCYLHGGRTPRGKDWHRPQPGADAAKTQRKLKDMERAAKRRTKRLAAMTPGERKRHEEWQRTHKPGPPGPRAAERARRAQNEEMRRRFVELEKTRPATAEIQELDAAIDELKRRLEQLQHSAEASPKTDEQGIFG